MLRKLIQNMKIPNWGLFVKLLIPLFLAMVIPTVTISLINYRVSKQSLESEVGQSNLDTLKQTKEAIDTIMQTTEKMAYHLVRDSDVQMFLNNDIELSKYLEIGIIKNVIQTMETYTESSPYIENVYFYSVNNQLLVSAQTGIYKKLDLLDFERMKQMAVENDGTAWITPAEQGLLPFEQENRVQMVKFLYKGNGQISGFVQIQLRNNEFLDLVQKIYIRKSGFITVTDENGYVILNDKTTKLTESFSERPWLRQKEGFAKLIMQENQRELLVSYTTSQYNGWKYVATVPVDELDDKSTTIRNNISLICVFFAALAILVSLGTARGLYSPINSIQRILRGVHVDESKMKKLLLRKDELGQINAAINEIAVVKDQLERSLPELRHYFLQRLATDDANVRQEIQQHAEFFALPISSTYVVWLVVFEKQPTSLVNPMLNESPDALDSNRDAFLNTFTNELSEWSAVAKIVAFYEQSDRFIGVMQLVEHPVNVPIFAEETKQWGFRFRDTINQRYGIQIALGIGRPYMGLERLNNSYRDAAQALKYKFVLGSNVVIYAGDVDVEEGSSFKFDYVKFISNALNTGQYEQAVSVVQDLRDYLKAHVYSAEGYVFYYRNILNMIIQHLQRGHQRSYLMIEQQLKNKFLQFENEFSDVDEATHWLAKQLELIAEEQKNEQPLNKVVQKAIDIIQQEYTQDPGLTELAERIKVTPAYLSRIFKEELGINFKEYLTVLKLEKAKQLLMEGDMTIEAIARQVGYHNHNQFARMFKKYENISAMEYRNLVKSTYRAP